MTEPQSPRMTVPEIALVRAIVRWRRTNGFEYVSDWSRYVCRDRKVSVAWPTLDRDDPSPALIGYTRDYPNQSYQWVPIESIVQAVDILVALGLLPARFSSAYRAGWEAVATALTRPMVNGGQRDAADLMPVVSRW